MDVVTLAIAKAYVNDSLQGLGALKGKNATISSITPINGGSQITFAYTLDDGTQQTSTLDVLDAYGIAKKNGFVGTEEEWLESLKMDVDELETIVQQEVTNQLGTQIEDTVEDKIDENLATEDLDFSGLF